MMRKYVALFLTALLLLHPLCVAADGAFNDGVMDWGECAHVYDNPCDTACNNCGAVRTVEGHRYTAQVTAAPTCGAAGVETYTCTLCGHSYTEGIPATGAHTYDNACDGVCNGCGYTRPIKGHVYDHGCDDTCNLCGEVRALKGHIYDNEADVSCNNCGAIRVPQNPGDPYTPGDLTEDGAVDNKDLVILVRWLNGWKVQVNLFAADVDGDGALSVKDAARLQQYLNGWDVEIG